MWAATGSQCRDIICGVPCPFYSICCRILDQLERFDCAWWALQQSRQEMTSASEPEKVGDWFFWCYTFICKHTHLLHDRWRRRGHQDLGGRQWFLADLVGTIPQWCCMEGLAGRVWVEDIFLREMSERQAEMHVETVESSSGWLLLFTVSSLQKYIRSDCWFRFASASQFLKYPDLLSSEAGLLLKKLISLLTTLLAKSKSTEEQTGSSFSLLVSTDWHRRQLIISAADNYGRFYNG